MLSGTTNVHSDFKILIKIYSNFTCSWPPHTMADVQVIIWDEISMQIPYAFEAVDWIFRELNDVDLPFGGKTFIFGGDFRQTLPVVQGGSIMDQGSMMYMLYSHLFEHVSTYHLTKSLFLHTASDHPNTQVNDDFAKLLLQFWNGFDYYRNYYQPPFWNHNKGPLQKHSLKLYHSCPVATSNNLTLLQNLCDYFRHDLILAPLNKMVHEINEHFLAMFLIIFMVFPSPDTSSQFHLLLLWPSTRLKANHRFQFSFRNQYSHMDHSVWIFPAQPLPPPWLWDWELFPHR